jgi:hypothetical protein
MMEKKMGDNTLLFIFLGISGLIMIRSIYKSRMRAKRKARIEDYQFPARVRQKVHEKYTHLTSDQVDEVIKGLKTYFQVCNISGKKMVSMPSQVVDVAWHEFILFTRNYEVFCKNALGRFLHHTPAEAMPEPTVAQKGIKRTWRISCYLENISADTPTTLPALFAIDAKLEIPDGFNYSLDCKKTGDGYCAAHIGCGSGCGGSSCSGDSGSSCSSGCGGGD